MAMAASHWEPDQKELSHLEGLGSEQAAVLAIGYVDGIAPWLIGKRAGYSGGLNDDEQKRRANWAAAASRGAKKKGKVLPEIRGLQEQLERYRKDGGKPFSVSWQQKKERLAYWVMHGGPNESIRATVEHNKMVGKGDSVPQGEQIVAMMIARVGREQARIGIEAMFPNLVSHLAEVDPAEAEANELKALNIRGKVEQTASQGPFGRD